MMEDLSIGPDESSNSDASSIRSVHTSERPVSISAFPANIDPALQPSIYVRQLEAASTTRPLTRARMTVVEIEVFAYIYLLLYTYALLYSAELPTPRSAGKRCGKTRGDTNTLCTCTPLTSHG